jgi:transposase
MAMVRAEVLGAIERRRRWHYEDKVRIVEASFAAGVTVTDVARRNGVAASLVFTWRRQARRGQLGGGSPAPLLLPVELAPVVADVTSTPMSEVAGAEPARRSRRSSGIIEIALGSAAGCGLIAMSMRMRCGGCSMCWTGDDRDPRRDAGLPRHGADRYAQGLRRFGGTGAAGAEAGSVLRSPVRLSRPPERPFEGAVLGRTRLLPVRQAAGERPLHLAGDDRRRGAAEPAQLSMLLEGIDWRTPIRTDRPSLAL